MNLTDIIALAKQGYKPNDIKDLIALAAESDPDTVEVVPDTSAQNEDKTGDTETEPAEAAEPMQHDTKTDDNSALHEEIDKLRKQLETAQAQNIKRNNSAEQQTDMDVIGEAFRKIIT